MRTLLALALLCAPAAFADRREVTLAEALGLAQKNSHDLKAAQAQAGVAKAQAERVIGAFLPELTAQGSLVHTTAPAVLDFGQTIQLVGGVYQLQPKDTSLIPAPISIVGANSAYGTLLASQLLFTPQMILLPAAKEGTEAARLGALEAQEQVLLNVARLYLGLEGLVELERAAKDAEGVALKRERDAAAQVKIGTAVEVASLRAQSETAQARNTLAQLQGNREGLEAMLSAICGEPVRALSGGPKPDLGPAAEEAAEPWEKTYAVRASVLGAQAAGRFPLADKLSFLPTIVAQVKGNFSSNPGFTGKSATADFILAANIPLYDRGARYSQLHEDEAKAAAAASMVDATRAKAKATWVGAKANLAAAQTALEQAEAQLALATRAQKQLDAAVQLGAATSLELSDIDNKRFFAASAAAQARAQLDIRKVELAAAEGRLAGAFGLAQNDEK
ncbi:MAG: TolC family protein [Myxococcaceae bacterium]|nr:TolC family protein [Myxococcaceae bacterium]